MNSKEYVIWLKGFVEACHEYAPTPKQWDTLKDKLAEVADESVPSFPFGTPNTTPMWQEPHYPNPFHKPYVDPYNPYKVTCQQPDTNGTKITTTPGISGTITISNPNLVSWGSGSLSTSTTYSYPSGSAWHYTNGGNDIKD
jgi:hypothetical protein